MNTKIINYGLIPVNAKYLQDAPSFFKVIHQEEMPSQLEDYFNDIYHLFLNRLVRITHESTLSGEEQKRLESLFQELLNIKALLQKEN